MTTTSAAANRQTTKCSGKRWPFSQETGCLPTRFTSLDELRYIHMHKTSDLIIFSLTAGGRAGGADSAQINALAGFGMRIGLAFQIRDDILDVVGDERVLGKKTNSDARRQKVTYPYLIGLDASRAEVERLTREAKEVLLDAGLRKPDLLLGIAEYLMSRDR
jgi:geranylgeranyl diphosphate synthase type II